MNAERWNKIKILFSSAQDCPEDERADFLGRACGGDKDLRIQVEKLLDSYVEDDSFLQNSAIEEYAGIFDGETTAGIGLPGSDPASPRFDVGALLNERYEIIRLLGRGGMGEVYLAADKRINRNVALKVLHSDLVTNKESLRRFALEAQAVSALNHPHIMTIYEFDSTADGTLFFVAEYIDGQILNHMVGVGTGLDKVLDIAIQVSSALSAAHEAGITHRDIKPENIMVRRDGYVKVLDFGLAKLTQQPVDNTPSSGAGSEDRTKALHRTKQGAVMGTAAYMSPEQARGIDVDARTDIWSLGVVIYQLVTGQRPFAGATTADIFVSVLSKEPPPMSTYAADLPPELEWIVSKALSKDVESRYQTSKELRADLEKIRTRLNVDETMSRSVSDGIDGGQPGEDKQVNGPGRAVPTSDGAAKATNDGQGGSTANRFAGSLPAISVVVEQAREHKVGSAIAVVALVALISSAVYFLASSAGGSRKIDSIAVLPFENLTGNPDLNYVADGLSENVIDRLSELPQLKVISRNSSFKFRGANVDVRNAASQMGVRAILTGTVAQIGDELAIRFDLVDAATDQQITGGQFRRKVGAIIRLQNDIAQAALEKLRLKLTDSQSKRVNDSVTENSEAYRYYLSGLVELNGPMGVKSKALEYFEQAVALDPNFAAAHAEIGWVYVGRANGSGDPNELMPKAKAAAERALAIDPDLAKAHVVEGIIREFEFDWPAAEKEYSRAIELSPNLDFARNQYAFFLSVMGRGNEALAELEQLRSRDPLNRRLGLLWKGIILVQARRFDEALQAYQEAQAAEPDKAVPSFALGYAYAGKGLYDEAVANYKKSVDQLGGEEKYSQPLVYLAATYAKMPAKRAEARTLLTRIEAMNVYVSPALLAAVYSALDDNDKAMALLEEAFIKRDLLLRYIGTAYEYDGLRTDPRFADLTKRIGLGK